MSKFLDILPSIIGAGFFGILVFVLKRYGATFFEFIKTKIDEIKTKMGDELFEKALNIAKQSVDFVINYIKNNPEIDNKVKTAYIKICDKLLEIFPLTDKQIKCIWDLIVSEFIEVFGEDFANELKEIKEDEFTELYEVSYAKAKNKGNIKLFRK